MLIRPLGHEELLLLLLQLTLLLGVARTCGELCRRLGTPAVVGELSAGVLLGPSVLGWLAPTLQALLFPASQLQADLLSVVTWLGVILLLLSTGLEMDLGLVRRMGRKAPLISLGGILVTFLAGAGLGSLLPDALLAQPDQRLVFVLFVATAMSISAIPVIARVLMELDAIRRDVGQLTLACGMIDDTVGWIMLSVVAALASAGRLDVWIPLKSVLAVLLLMGFTLTLGRRLVAGLYRWADDTVADRSTLTSLTMVLTLGMAALTLYLGLEAVLGAFLFGMVLREAPRYRPELTHGLEEITRVVFSPIFFASAGLKVNLGLFFDVELLPYALLVLGVACAGKFVGVFLGGKLAGLTTVEALAMGSGLNARGAMEIIVATIGLSLGVLSLDMYSIIVFVAIATSLMAPPLLRAFLRQMPLRPEEARRLERERRARESFWQGVRKVLLPTRGGGNARLAAGLLGRALKGSPAEVTVLGLQPTPAGFQFWRKAQDEDAATRASALAVAEAAVKPMTARSKVLQTEGRSPAQVILEQAREHDLIVLGASKMPSSRTATTTFGKLIDEVLQGSQRPVLVVRQPGGETVSVGEEAIPPLRKILLPTTGTSTGKASRELGTTLGRLHGAVCTFLFVEESEQEDGREEEWREEEERENPLNGASHELLEDEEGELKVELLTVKAHRAGTAIVEVAREGGFDLIVMNAQLRQGTSRAFLGPQVDYVLSHAHCPVALLVTR